MVLAFAAAIAGAVLAAPAAIAAFGVAGAFGAAGAAVAGLSDADPDLARRCTGRARRHELLSDSLTRAE